MSVGGIVGLWNWRARARAVDGEELVDELRARPLPLALADGLVGHRVEAGVDLVEGVGEEVEDGELRLRLCRRPRCWSALPLRSTIPTAGRVGRIEEDAGHRLEHVRAGQRLALRSARAATVIFESSTATLANSWRAGMMSVWKRRRGSARSCSRPPPSSTRGSTSRRRSACTPGRAPCRASGGERCREIDEDLLAREVGGVAVRDDRRRSPRWRTPVTIGPEVLVEAEALPQEDRREVAHAQGAVVVGQVGAVARSGGTRRCRPDRSCRRRTCPWSEPWFTPSWSGIARVLRRGGAGAEPDQAVQRVGLGVQRRGRRCRSTQESS